MVEQWSPKPKVKGSNPFSPDASWKQTAVALSKATGTIERYSYYFIVGVLNQLKINTELAFAVLMVLKHTVERISEQQSGSSANTRTAGSGSPQEEEPEEGLLFQKAPLRKDPQKPLKEPLFSSAALLLLLAQKKTSTVSF